MMKEKELQNTLLQAARLLGWRAYHTFDSRRSAPGFPDLVLVGDTKHQGRLAFWELKSQRGQLSYEQSQWLSALSKVPGVDVNILKPEDLDLALAWLRDPTKVAA